MVREKQIQAGNEAVDPVLMAADPVHVCCHVLAGADCAIRPFSLCNAVEGRDVDALEKLARPTQFKARHQFLRQGEPVTSLFNITEGVVCLSRMLGDGRRQVMGFLLPGDFFDLSLPVNASYSAHALTAVTACQFDRAQFLRFIGDHPALLQRVYLLTTRELSAAQEQMSVLGRLTAEEKIAAFLMGLRQRLVRNAGLSDTVSLPMSRQDIADYLGLTIETVSRTFTRLEREGALGLSRSKAQILDLGRLEALASSVS